ncbi:MAG: Stp1/IreP family PP2C-type Ser/Thr phosphatase [Mariprofundus sp.]|nr:Stp1/IreP family PP2C-type Ser/Thr phosphatase [Mariprofundus sp.]
MMTYEMHAMTDIGIRRQHNEDCVVASSEYGFAVLADGMGGYNAGEVASAMAVEMIGKRLEDQMLNMSQAQINIQTGFAEESMLVRQSIEAANEAIYTAAHAKAEYAGMGTTVLVAAFYGEHITAAHVGDSRMYRLRDNVLSHVTEDHSLVHEQVRRGLLTADDARNSRIKNLVTRALGVELGVEPDLLEDMVKANDIYLLSSDGLTDVVSDEAISEILSTHQSRLEKAGKLLIDMANKAGGPDNISVILIKVTPAKAKNGFFSRFLKK